MIASTINIVGTRRGAGASADAVVTGSAWRSSADALSVAPTCRLGSAITLLASSIGFAAPSEEWSAGFSLLCLVTRGEFRYGNNNGAKQALGRDYLAQADSIGQRGFCQCVCSQHSYQGDCYTIHVDGIQD